MDVVKEPVFCRKFELECDFIDYDKYFGEFANAIPPWDTCPDEKCKNSRGTSDCGAADCKNDEICRNFLGITQEQLAELKTRTSVDHLKCEDEPEYVNDSADSGVPDVDEEDEPTNDECSSPLVSAYNRWEMINVTKTKFPRKQLKYCNYEWTVSKDVPANENIQFDTLKFPTMVACVKVYHPFLSDCKTAKVKLLQEIHILGDQTLAQLKDKITCSHDYIGDKDMSNEFFLKNVGVNITAKDECPSSFIFIENTFYNDTRKRHYIDISKEIREWAAEKNLSSFQTGQMESTKVSDLKEVRIGRPYVYVHLGNCEHLIVFSDIRLLHDSDPPRFSSFPRVHCTGRVYGRHCMMCSDYYARWLVVGSERLTHDKAYMCDKCFKSYNYVDGRKIGEFQAYKYVDLVGLL